MNFLEQVAAEWYAYQGYFFVRTNVKFGKRVQGGYEGEMDVVAYNPSSNTLVHIETSTDAKGWPKRSQIIQEKFYESEKYYEAIFNFKSENVKKVAIFGYTKPNS